MSSSVSTKVAVKKSKFGKGLFAASDLSAGEILMTIEGESINFKEAVALGDKECYCVQVDVDRYIVPNNAFQYSNHACEPNCGINENLQFITLRPIRKGEELLWDYSTSMLERHWTMQCYCNSKNCRSVVQDFDFLPEEVQHKYTMLSIVLPFILKQKQAVPVPATVRR